MSDPSSGMPLPEVLQILHEARRDEVVVATMGSGREWSKFAPHPLDLVYVPSSMGQATSVGLGIALAQPDRKVVVCNGDGSMLMNLGSLVTINKKHAIVTEVGRNSMTIFTKGKYETVVVKPGTVKWHSDKILANALG